MSGSLDETIEKSVSGGLRCDPRRRRFADHAQPLNETDENSGGTCRLNAISQLARRLRTGKGIRHPRLHGLEKVRDATTDFGILASQFHGCGHQQTSAPALGAGRAVYIAGKIGPQAVDRLSAGVQFDIHSCQGIGNVAIKRTQKERVLVAESGVKAATREFCRAKKVRERRGMITARPEHAHRAFDSGFHVETAGAATGQLHWGLAAHHRYIDQSVFKSQVLAGSRPASSIAVSGSSQAIHSLRGEMGCSASLAMVRGARVFFRNPYTRPIVAFASCFI